TDGIFSPITTIARFQSHFWGRPSSGDRLMPVIPDLGILPCRAGITHLIYRKRSLHISLLLVGLLLAGPRLSAFAPGRVKPKPAAGDARAMRARTEVVVPSETAAVGGANLCSVKEAGETVLHQRREAGVFSMIRFCRETLGYGVCVLDV